MYNLIFRMCHVIGDSSEKKFPIDFFQTFPECSPPSIVSEKTIKMIGHHSRLRDMMGQSYPIYACSRANYTIFNRRFTLNFAVARNILG